MKYLKMVSETSVFPKNVDNFTTAYAWLGLMDETYEFLEKRESYPFMPDSMNSLQVSTLVKELGDVCWYTGALINEHNLNPDNVLNQVLISEGEGQEFPMLLYNGNIKKYYRDDQEIDNTELEALLLTNLQSLFSTMPTSITLESVLIKNVEKLGSRKKRGVIKGNGDNR